MGFLIILNVIISILHGSLIYLLGSVLERNDDILYYLGVREDAPKEGIRQIFEISKTVIYIGQILKILGIFYVVSSAITVLMQMGRGLY